MDFDSWSCPPYFHYSMCSSIPRTWQPCRTAIFHVINVEPIIAPFISLPPSFLPPFLHFGPRTAWTSFHHCRRCSEYRLFRTLPKVTSKLLYLFLCTKHQTHIVQPSWYVILLECVGIFSMPPSTKQQPQRREGTPWRGGGTFSTDWAGLTRWQQ